MGMKVKYSFRDHKTGVEYTTEYDDVAKTHTVLHPYTGEVISDACGPINDTVIVNGREYVVQTDPHSGRKVCAYTETKPYDPREFDSDQDYQDFLAGKPVGKVL
jgi:hypothetical protein